ncbi:MAG TPA: RdgB/HAM1 family non-canonical purine NTP pyrophosphatase [Erysipelothrix sp.]
MKILIASGNEGKIKEFKQLLGPLGFAVYGAKELGYTIDVEETADTFLGNALIKARYLYEKAQMPVLADDSGLVLEAFPDLLSVHSARFMQGESYEKKHEALLKRYETVANRQAYFETALVLITDDVYTFTGQVDGHIALSAKGDQGFGYDPIFIPNGYDKTFAQIPEVKEKISHRAIATQKLLNFLKEQQNE